MFACFNCADPARPEYTPSPEHYRHAVFKERSYGRKASADRHAVGASHRITISTLTACTMDRLSYGYHAIVPQGCLAHHRCPE